MSLNRYFKKLSNENKGFIFGFVGIIIFSIGVAPAGILAAVAFIMSRNYGSKQIGILIHMF